MAYRVGRLIDHVHLRVADLERSKRFYRAVLESLGLQDAIGEDNDCFYADELFIDQADSYISHVHLAFQARSRTVVDRFHASAIQAGGTDNGRPGLRHYHRQYYAAFVLDPDGNNVEAVCDAPVRRSADTITVERLKGD